MLISRKASLTFYQSCLAYLYILFNALGSLVSMYAAGTDSDMILWMGVDSDMILWMGVAFHALAHLMKAFVHVSRDELREVVKTIDVIGGREASNVEDMDCSIATTTTTTTTTTSTTTTAAASTAVSTKKQQPAPLTM